MIFINSQNYYKIKPAARIITSIGQDLIKDIPAAIVELVKNSYDADASEVIIEFSISKDSTGMDQLKLLVKDNGHGMNFDTVVNKWMVPATNDKLGRKNSTFKERPMQGRKGLGRFASAILGEELVVETIDVFGEKTTAVINWGEFEKKEFLSEIDILIESEVIEKSILKSLLEDNNIDDSNGSDSFIKSLPLSKKIDILEGSNTGTELHITGSNNILKQWTEAEIRKLIKELKKLLSPIDKDATEKDEFQIILKFVNFPIEGFENREIQITPFPLLNMYDYRIYGYVSELGKVNIHYEYDTHKGYLSEEIPEYFLELEEGEFCGPIEIDLRVFDKDPDSIDNLIKKGKGIVDESGNFLGKNEVKRLIKEYSGVSIFRGDFRIRPYGEQNFDWLGLDNQRIQNPSLRIGNDQIVGFIKIGPEEISNLEEKSARDGLKENQYFLGLINVVKDILFHLEERRFRYRKKTGKGRKHTLIKHQLDELFDFTKLSNSLEQKLKSFNLQDESISEVKKLIEKSEKDKAHLYDEIQETIAVYQGQATLGKIVMVIQHEGRRPLGYIRNQTPRIIKWSNELKSMENIDKELLSKVVNRIDNTKNQMELISSLFNKLDPLSVKKRGKRKQFNIINSIKKVHELFEHELTISNIKIEISCDKDLLLYGWEEDIIVCLTNLFENSIYWVNRNKDKEKLISIKTFKDEDLIIIDFRDNGPGIEENKLEDNSIFEPGFSTKPQGTGLGLAIAGEAISRNEGELKALKNESGAYFRIEFKGKE